MKKILLYILLITSAVSTAGLIVLHREEQKADQQLQRLYGIYSSADLKESGISGSTSAAGRIYNGKPAVSEQADVTDDVLFELSDPNGVSSPKLFNNGRNNTGNRSGSSAMGMDYYSQDKNNRSVSGGGASGGMAFLRSSGNSRSMASGGGESGFMNIPNRSNLFTSDVGVQANGGNADPGRNISNLTPIPVPPGFYVLLVAGLIYGIRIFVLRRRKLNKEAA